MNMKKIVFLLFLCMLFNNSYSQEEVGIPDSSDSDQIFQKIEQSPEFPGGLEAWKRYLIRNIKMDAIVKKAVPKKAKSWTQVAHVRFIVDRNGNVTDVHVINKVHEEVKKEAIRLLTNSPRWIPGRHNGRKVKAYFVQPITFVVEDE